MTQKQEQILSWNEKHINETQLNYPSADTSIVIHFQTLSLSQIYLKFGYFW